MKLEIKIDTAIVEPETVITTSAMTDEVNRVVNYISNLENTSFMITGQKDGKIELLDQENIIRLLFVGSYGTYDVNRIFSGMDGTFYIRFHSIFCDILCYLCDCLDQPVLYVEETHSQDQ